MEQDLPLSTDRGLRWTAPLSGAARTITGWRWSAAWPALCVALVALALRLALIARYPLLYDGDAYGRFLSRDHPFNAPWVPLFQVIIYLLTRVADSILAVRLLSAFFGATAALAFWLVLRRAFGAPVAYLGALLLAINPLFVTFSVVPYQEGLFLTLAFLALWLALAPDRVRWPWLILVLALAGLTRYEGWLLSLFIWLLFLWRRRRADALTWRFAAGSALALAWAPLLWIAVNRNVSPIGIQTLSPTLNPASLLATLGAEWPLWQLNLSLVGGILALGGLLWLGWQARRGQEPAWLLLAFLLGDVLVLAFLRPFSPDNLRLPLLSLPVIIAGVAGLLVAGAQLLWRVVRLRPLCARQRVLAAGVFGLATAVLCLWYLPLAAERVAAYDALVRPAYLAADDLEALAQNTTVAVLGNNAEFAAFTFYAVQDGWRGQATQLDSAAAADPATLAAALRVSHARLLVIYGPAATSAAVAALVRQGILAPTTTGPGYAIWQVQAALPAGT